MALRLLAFSMIALGMEPIATVPMVDPDAFMRYAVTQGGLLCVVLVLLWHLRSEQKRKDKESASQIEVLTTLVGDTKATMQRQISVGEAQEKAMHRLAKTMDKFLDA